ERFAQLFGKSMAFTATAHVSVMNSSGRESNAAEMDYAMLDGMLRTEINMANTSAGEKSASAMEKMAGLGMSVMVQLIRPDKKASYVIYPGLKGYCESQLGKPTKKTEAATPAKVEKTKV